MSDVAFVDENNFDAEVLQAKSPVIVDFIAVWCGPCQRQLPIIEKFAADNKHRVKVVKIDVDESSSIAAKYGIKDVPSLILFHKGNRIHSKVGLTTESALDTMLVEKVGV